MNALSSIRLFLLDLDGTFYLDGAPLPGALDFLAALRGKGVPFAFLTNNSSRSRGGLPAAPERHGGGGHPGAKCSPAPTPRWTISLKTIFPAGCCSSAPPAWRRTSPPAATRCAPDAPQAVVLGFDTTLTYEKLVLLCDAVPGPACPISPPTRTTTAR